MEQEQNEKLPVQVPQYEEYRTGSWLGVLCQWIGGIGLVLMGLMYWVMPSLYEGTDGTVYPIAGAFLAMFLIPTLRGRRRSRENQAISRRNQRKYDQYCSSLKLEQEKET